MKINKNKYELVRAKKCVSVKELEDSGISRSVLCSALTRGARPETVGKIAKALGCDVTEIIDN